jgi:cytochrome b561
MHAVGRWALIVFIGLHVLGALKHVFIDRDGIMRRMLAPPKSA